MPHLTFVNAVRRIKECGADAVKRQLGAENSDISCAFVEVGVPVMRCVGLLRHPVYLMAGDKIVCPDHGMVVNIAS